MLLMIWVYREGPYGWEIVFLKDWGTESIQSILDYESLWLWIHIY